MGYRYNDEPNPNKFYTWRASFTLKVNAIWVADGFELTDARLQEFLEDAVGNYLSSAYGHEYEVKNCKVLQAPTQRARIAREMGYPSVEALEDAERNLGR